MKRFSYIVLLMLSFAQLAHASADDHRRDLPRRNDKFLFASHSIPKDRIASQCAELIWRNGNNDFYARISPAEFEARVKAVGLHKHADLRTPAIMRLLGLPRGLVSPSNAVVVIGSQGREIEFLRRETDVPYIHVVEVSHENYTHIRDNYEFDSQLARWRDEQKRPMQKLVVHEENIGAALDPWGRGVIDVAFWMFAGIAELHPQEKYNSIHNIHAMLLPGGKCVVDLPVGQVMSDKQLAEMTPASDYFEVPNPHDPEITLRNHPISPATGEVETQKIIDLFTLERLFTLDMHYYYYTDAEPPQKRQILIFKKPGSTSPAASRRANQNFR